MACLKFVQKDISRYQLEYPLTRSDNNRALFASEPLEIGYTRVSLEDSDSSSFTFSRPFSGTPNVVAGFVSLDPGAPNVNLYVESVTDSGGVLRTSAPVNGQVAVHAVYNPSPPAILSPPVIEVLP